jgi:integrase
MRRRARPHPIVRLRGQSRPGKCRSPEYSGLRIGDTIALRRDQLVKNHLFLYTQKTGQPVRVPLPDFVVEALKTIDNGEDRFFWTGKNLRSAVANWSRYLASVFDHAHVKNAHSHRFRDTFATGLLLAGVPIEDVSILLGHSNTRITAKAVCRCVRRSLAPTAG